VKQLNLKNNARPAELAAPQRRKGEWTLNQLASQFRMHPVQIGQWGKTALEHLSELFVDGRKRRARDGDVEKEALYEEIGRLSVELDWLKKSWPARMRSGARWSSLGIQTSSACGASASCSG